MKRHTPKSSVVTLVALNVLVNCAPDSQSPEVTGSTSAPLAFVQANDSTPRGTAIPSVSVTYSGAQAAGDLNVVAIGWSDTTASVVSVADTQGNAYAVAAPTIQDSNGPASETIWYAPKIAGAHAAANIVTVTFGGTGAKNPDVRIAEYSGLSPSPFDVAAGQSGTLPNGSQTTVSSGAATTTASGDLIVGANRVGWTTDGPGAGFTKRVITSPNSDILEDEIAGAAGPYAATAVIDDSSGGSSHAWWIMQMAAFKAAAASDAGSDSGPDASDAGADTGNDSKADTGSDTGADSGQDAASDAGTDANVDKVPVMVQHVSGSSTRNNGLGTPHCYYQVLANPATAGNAIAVEMTWQGNAIPSATDDRGDTYVVAANYYDATDNESLGILLAPHVVAGARAISACFNVDPGGSVQVAATELAGIVRVDGTGSGASGMGTTAAAAPLAPSVSGDYILSVAWSSSLNQTNFAPGDAPDFAGELLSADLMDGFAVQGGVYYGTAPLSPPVYMGTAHNWAAVAVSLKAGLAGSVPSGMRIVHLDHENVPYRTGANGGHPNAPFPNPLTIQWPSSGNLLVAMISGGNQPETVTSIVDSRDNTWVEPCPTQIGANDPTSMAWYAAGANTDPNLQLTLSWTGATGDYTLMLYDVAGARSTAPFDACSGGTGNQTSTSGALQLSFALTTTAPGDLVFAQTPWRFNTCTGMTGGLVDVNRFAGEDLNGPEPVDENNCWGHVWVPNPGAVRVTWTQLSTSQAAGAWAASMLAFKGD